MFQFRYCRRRHNASTNSQTKSCKHKTVLMQFIFLDFVNSIWSTPKKLHLLGFWLSGKTSWAQHCIFSEVHRTTQQICTFLSLVLKVHNAYFSLMNLIKSTYWWINGWQINYRVCEISNMHSQNRQRHGSVSAVYTSQLQGTCFNPVYTCTPCVLIVSSWTSSFLPPPKNVPVDVLLCYSAKVGVLRLLLLLKY